MNARRLVLRAGARRGTMLAGDPGRASIAGRRVVLLAVRGAAAARLRLLRDRAVRRRPRDRARRGRMVTGTLLFVLGFTVRGSSSSARPSGALGDWLCEYTRADQRRPRRRHDPRRPRVHGRRCRGCSATCGCTACPPSAWPPRRCSACSSRSAGRRASARPSPPSRGWPTPRARPAAARCSASPTPSASASRSSLLGLAYRRMLGAVRWVRRHQVWVTRARRRSCWSSSACCWSPGWWDLWVAELRGWVGGFEVPV